MFQWSPFQLSGHCPYNRANRPVVWSHTPRRYSTNHPAQTIFQVFVLFFFFIWTTAFSSFLHFQFTMLQSSCSISTSVGCRSASNWTRGTKLQNMRWVPTHESALLWVFKWSHWVLALWHQASFIVAVTQRRNHTPAEQVMPAADLCAGMKDCFAPGMSDDRF